MRSFLLIPHTADTRIRVEGSSLEELFRAGIEGISKILKARTKEPVKNLLEEEIFVHSSFLTILLVDFLSEVLAKSYLNNAIFDKIKFRELTDKHLKAKIFGAKVEKFDRDIKAVTYHEANVITNEKGNWETTIVFDI